MSLVVESPGRINLIGEHVDYSGGYVLPAAIDKKITLKFKKNNSDQCSIYSKSFQSRFEINLNNVVRSDVQWRNYILGVIFQINKIKPNAVEGFDCEFESDLPLGSGMSSSAALECGFAKGLNELFNIGLSDIQLITLSKDAEHSFVGTKCGIMDQFAVIKGRKNHLLLLNCETLEHQLIEADFGKYQIILLNTNVSHNLASSEYNVRRDECISALEIIQEQYPQFNLLAQVSPKIVSEFKNILPKKIFNRAMFVTKETNRTLDAVAALRNNDIEAFGRRMYESHSGLSELYEVSCDELDFLVDYTKDLEYVIGARMMGGGFGGCTINLVQTEFVDSFVNKIATAYKKQFNINLSPIFVAISKGTSIV